MFLILYNLDALNNILTQIIGKNQMLLEDFPASYHISISHNKLLASPQLNSELNTLFVKTVLFRIISIVRVPSLFSNKDNIRSHDDES